MFVYQSVNHIIISTVAKKIYPASVRDIPGQSQGFAWTIPHTFFKTVNPWKNWNAWVYQRDSKGRETYGY